ncbi:MAG TPA: bifunctional shikimate kinase/3-dehydroquinate synthase [Candidatus Sulfotelmatobacter sp.]|nr:bifunctional shikimate kinase/3-dehydroquinate synthase [Candidatus Sulfotelmatobacter sp.]
MELVLIGLPGSGKSAVGRRIAHAHHAEFVDLDAAIEARAGAPPAAIFEREGEAAFRVHEAAAIDALGEPDRSHPLRRVVATGGGAVVAPRNRWRLFRDRRVVWLDAADGVLARRLERSATPRPLLVGRDPVRALEALRAARLRFYAAAPRVDATGRPDEVAPRVERSLRGGAPALTLLDAHTRVGELVLGLDMAGGTVARVLDDLRATRVAVVSEPAAWRLHGERLTVSLAAPGRLVEPLLLPRGERAKSFAALERAVRELARRQHERGDPLVTIGGGAVGDTGGLVAALYARGVPFIQVPTTLLGQIDSSIGGKTAIDIPEGKNLVGAFHQPRAIVLDVGLLATLPPRQRRAALGEAVKMAALGDEALFDLLEREGRALAAGSPAAVASGALAELVERCAWAKVEVVLADEREADRRMALNLGHSIGHALESANGYHGLLHGEAVALGLRGAVAVGLALGVTPAARGRRIVALLDHLGLGMAAPAVPAEEVRVRLARDKKVAGGRLRWVLPTATGIAVRADVPDGAVDAGLAAALRGAA